MDYNNKDYEHKVYYYIKEKSPKLLRFSASTMSLDNCHEERLYKCKKDP